MHFDLYINIESTIQFPLLYQMHAKQAATKKQIVISVIVST